LLWVIPKMKAATLKRTMPEIVLTAGKILETTSRLSNSCLVGMLFAVRAN